MSVTVEQESVWTNSAGIGMSEFYLFIATLLLSLFLILSMKILKGSLRGFGDERITAYQVLARGARLTFLFMVILFLVTQ